MTGDAFLTEPGGRAGRAMQAGARTPLLDQEFDSGTLYALRAAVQAQAGQAGLSEDRVGEVVLAVHELAANVIAHGAGHGHLRMWEAGGRPSGPTVRSPRYPGHRHLRTAVTSGLLTAPIPARRK
jgi:hypothetical protein